MDHIYLNSVITQETINEIKFLSLYYDKISIIHDIVYTIELNPETNTPDVKGSPFLPSNFESDYKYLLEEGVLEIIKRKEGKEDDEFDSMYAESISKLVNDKWNYLFPKNGDNIIISDEIKNVIQYTFGENKKVPLNFLWYFYAFKLKRSLQLLIEGKKCLNSSTNLDYLFNEYISLNTHIKPQFDSGKLIRSAIYMSLPSVDMLNFEDILELKIKLKDELAQFSDVIHSIEFKYKNQDINTISSNEYDIIFKQEIETPYKDLQRKIKSLRGRTFLSFIDQAKDINTYIPMIGSFIASIPLKYSLMLSLGLISLETYQEYKISKNEINDNGLNYLIRLNRDSRLIPSL